MVAHLQVVISISSLSCSFYEPNKNGLQFIVIRIIGGNGMFNNIILNLFQTNRTNNKSQCMNYFEPNLH